MYNWTGTGIYYLKKKKEEAAINGRAACQDCYFLHLQMEVVSPRSARQILMLRYQQHNRDIIS